MNGDFWRGKKVFLTGHTGFKGTWLSVWLHHLGADVTGYALPAEKGSMFELTRIDRHIRSRIGDIRDLATLKKELHVCCPDIVLHLAAQPLVKISYRNPVETYETNVMGTVNLLEAVRTCDSVRAVLNVTTDKVYENKEQLQGYKETDALGGYDPYSNSKACSELVTSSYMQSFFNPEQYDRHGVAVATARAGNVIGGGDWSQDRLVPDLIRSILAGKEIVVRNPNSIRPWQHVLEPLHGYLMLAEKLYTGNSSWSGAWNFGPEEEEDASVHQLIELFRKQSPFPFPELIIVPSEEHETNRLKLDIAKSRLKLQWQPIWTLEKTVKKILEWHASAPSEAYRISIKQIEEYEADYA